MSSIKEKQREVADYQTIQLVTNALRDIGALDMHGIKLEFQKGQSYYREVEGLYKLIKVYASKRKLNIEVSEKRTTRGTLFVAITSNKRLYGSLNSEVMKALRERMDADSQSTFFVIGQFGKQYFQNTPYETRCTFFEFKEDDPTQYETIVFVDTTRRYENVFMFYPKFENVFRQTITLTDIAYIPEPPKKEDLKIDYIFEPDLGEIFWFFETQVRYILFNQILLENKLARISSRLLRLNAAEESIINLIREKQKQLYKIKSTRANIQLLETFSGISTWIRNS